MAYSTGHSLPAGLGDTPSGADWDRPATAYSYSPVGTRSVTFHLITEARSDLSVILTAKPVFSLLHQGVVGARLSRSLRIDGSEPALMAGRRGRLSLQDLKRIDVESLEHGAPLLDLSGGATGVVPAFWQTVASSTGRFSLLYAGLQADAGAGLHLVEIVGVDMNANVEDIGDAMVHLGTQRRGAIINFPLRPGVIARMAAVQPRCVSLDFAGVRTEGAVAWREAADLIAEARSVAPNVLLVNLPAPRGEAAAAAGATHAVFCDMSPLTA